MKILLKNSQIIWGWFWRIMLSFRITERVTTVQTALPVSRQPKDKHPQVTHALVTRTTGLGSGPQPQLPVASSFSALAELRRLFLLCSSLRPSRRVGTLPIRPRAGGGCSAGCRPSPPPQPRAPPCPAPRVSCRPPTSGYRRQPPRLWHYGHGGGDGSAEAEQAGHQGAGIVRWLPGPGVRGPEPRLSCWLASV